MTTTTTEYRAWIGCLACYNDGKLVGEWLPADEADEWTCPNDPTHEEFNVFDTDGLPSYFAHEMCPSAFVELVETLEQLRSWHPVEAFAAYCATAGETEPNASTLGGFGESYQGEFDSVEEYAEQFARDVGLIGDETDRWPLNCIDWEHAARELNYGGDIWTADAPGHHVYVFSGNV